MSDTPRPFAPTLPVYLVAAQDGVQARRRDEPRDPAPYLLRYAGRRSLVRPEDAWLAAYDAEDERLRFAQSRPSVAGEDLWRAVPRRRDAGLGRVVLP